MTRVERQPRNRALACETDKFTAPEVVCARHCQRIHQQLADGVALPTIIRRLTNATARRSLTSARMNLALALINACRNQEKLKKLTEVWQLDERRSLKGSYWFALALLEGCYSLLVGTAGERPSWLNTLCRLVCVLADYAADGYIRSGPENVRRYRPYANFLQYRCRKLEKALQDHQTPGDLGSDPARALYAVRNASLQTVPEWPENVPAHVVPAEPAPSIQTAPGDPPDEILGSGRLLFSLSRNGARGTC